MSNIDCKYMKDDRGQRVYTGACQYRREDRELIASELSTCPSLGMCDNCPARESWGACFVEDVHNSRTGSECFCIPRSSEAAVQRALQGACFSQRIGGSRRVYDNVCTFGDIGDFEFEDCMDIPHFAGKCPIEVHPLGGCFVKDPTKPWGCFQGQAWRSPEECRRGGFDGGCLYDDIFRQPLKEEDVHSCYEAGQCLVSCHPTSEKWGACFVEADAGEDEMCQCLSGDVAVQAALKHGCLTRPAGLVSAFNGICRFDEQKHERPITCASVPSFHYSGGTTNCLQTSLRLTYACFTTENHVPWKCYTDDERNPSCRSTPTGASGSYEGGCVFRGAFDYDNATSYEGKRHYKKGIENDTQ